MEVEDVHRVITQFVDAALRCQQGGLDGVELLSHSQMLGQYLSPLVNQRKDALCGHDAATGRETRMPHVIRAADVRKKVVIISSWEILGGDARVSGEILLIDEIGDQSATVCADVIARQGCTVLMVTPDRAIAHDPGPTDPSVVLRDLALQNVTFQCFYELASLEKDGNCKKAT